MRFNSGEVGGNGHSLRFGGQLVNKAVEWFKYLGLIVQANGWMAEQVAGKINCGWIKWRKAIQVMCDKKKVLPIRLKGKFYKIVVSQQWFMDSNMGLKQNRKRTFRVARTL